MGDFVMEDWSVVQARCVQRKRVGTGKDADPLFLKPFRKGHSQNGMFATDPRLLLNSYISSLQDKHKTFVKRIGAHDRSGKGPE